MIKNANATWHEWRIVQASIAFGRWVAHLVKGVFTPKRTAKEDRLIEKDRQKRILRELRGLPAKT